MRSRKVVASTNHGSPGLIVPSNGGFLEVKDGLVKKGGGTGGDLRGR